MKIATILAIANESDGTVRLELRSESDHPASIKVAGGETWLASPMVIPLVEAKASPKLNHVEVGRGRGPNVRQVYLWREKDCIYANSIPDKVGAAPLQLTDKNPADPTGIQLKVYTPKGAGGGWVIGDIIGAKT